MVGKVGESSVTYQSTTTSTLRGLLLFQCSVILIASIKVWFCMGVPEFRVKLYSLQVEF